MNGTGNEQGSCAVAVPAEPAPGKWQPIETAPETGAFLVYLPKEEMRQFQVMYRNGRVTIIGGAFAFDLSKPTHWMPLPEAPK